MEHYEGRSRGRVSLKPGEGVGEIQTPLLPTSPLHQAGGGNCDGQSEAKGRPISGVLETAISWTVIGPPNKALRPALTACAKPPAIRTRSRPPETPLFSTTPS